MVLSVREKLQEELGVLPTAEALAFLHQLRDTSPISSRNTSKGALVKETYELFNNIHAGLPISNARQTILEAGIIKKTSYETRRRVWDAIKHRYLSINPEWVARALANASEYGADSPEYLSLAYLYFVLRDRLVFCIVTELIWGKWQQQTTTISRGDVVQFLEEMAKEHPQIKRWRESTRLRLASSILAALRDFGLLKGIQKKLIQRPLIASTTILHLLYILMSEGLEGRKILEAPDWRLFLWTEMDVIRALGELSQQQWIRFEKSGNTVILELKRLPEAVA